ncbi:hypothetical protein BS47DRAFT_616696 [Hydnum rufescens UP504]|uniref:Uncharacterized protein n=1 Tax=Hydnum rufescens UP504 TaxID=1448309 RepID=A0A9P6AF96_9AGAM|nr:hypothetical protein BS47DRAFT_616696 [Hydnum rufescens UP504]
MWGDQRDPSDRWDERFMLVCLENSRQIENWLKIELSGPDTQGTVTFGTTKETLHEGLPSLSDFVARIAEDTLSVTRFSHQIQDICTEISGPIALSTLVTRLQDMHEGQ